MHLRRSIIAGALTGAIFGLLAAILVFATHHFLFGIGWDTAGYGILNILLFTAGGAVFGVAFAIVSQFVGRAIASLSLTVLFWGIGGFSVGSLPATLAFTGVFLAIAGLEGRRELGAIPLAALLVAPLVSLTSPVGSVTPYVSSMVRDVLLENVPSLFPQTAVYWNPPHHSWRVEVYVRDKQNNPIPYAVVALGPPPEVGGYVYGFPAKIADNLGRAYFYVDEQVQTFVLYAFAKGYRFENRLVQITGPQTFTVVLENVAELKHPHGVSGYVVMTSYYQGSPYYTYAAELYGLHSTDGGWGCVLRAFTYGTTIGELTISTWGEAEGSRLQGWYDSPGYKGCFNLVSSASVSLSGTTASVSSHSEITIISASYWGYPIPEGGLDSSVYMTRYWFCDASQSISFSSTENGDILWTGEGTVVMMDTFQLGIKHSGTLRMVGRDVNASLNGMLYFLTETPETRPGDPLASITVDLTLKDIGPGIRAAPQVTVVEQYFPTQVTTIEKKVPTLVAAPAPAPTPALPALVTFSLAALVLSLLSLALAIRK